MGGTARLIVGGQVLDLDEDLDHPPVTDILIEDGRIAAIGAAAQAACEGRSDVERIDASGKLVIPGLVNAHYHSHDVLLRGLFEQLPLDIWGFYSFPSNYSRFLDEDVRLRTLLGADECLLNGITTVQDMVTITNADAAHAEAIVEAYGTSGMRTVLAFQIADKAAAEAVPYWDKLPEPTCRHLPGPVSAAPLQALVERLVAESTPDRLNWALGPSAPQRCSDDLLRWTADLSERHGLQVFTHLYEARSQAVLARTSYEGGSLLDHLQRFGLLGPRLTIAHGVWISDEELSRFGAAGANLAFNPVSNMKLLNGFAPIRRYRDRGANVALGCDNCSGNDVQNIFQSMKMFALYWGLQSPAGEMAAAREAFRAATVGGARALGMEDEIGRLLPGYRADMVLIDLDAPCYRPLNSALRQLVYGETGSSIDTVIVGGEVVARKGELVGARAAELKSRSEEALARLLPEIEAVAKRNEAIVPDLLDAYRRADAYPLSFDRYSMRAESAD